MLSILPERFTTVGLALCLGLLLSGLISAADKPLLSEAIDEAIAEHGAAAAIQLFADNYERDKDRYTVDMKGISDLGGKYAMDHKLEEAGAVMQIASPYIYRTTSSSNRTPIYPDNA